MKRALLSLLLVLCASPSAAAQVDTYPIESFDDWTDSPRRDVQDRDLGQYNFEEGFYGTARRAAQRYPEHLTGPDIARELQAAHDALMHNRPDAPDSHWGDVGHPDYMPDWDRDGVYGDSGGFDPNGVGDFDADTDETLDTAWFRIPCYTAADEWLVHHLGAEGSCDLAGAGPHVLGVAHEVKVTNARGLVLDGTLWLPPGACASLDVVSCEGSFPGVVFSNGLSSRQEHYYWFAMRMAGAGYVVLTYDPAGQGQSEGGWSDLFGFTDSQRIDCEFAGSCRDLRDISRWFIGEPIAAVTDTGYRFVPRADPATNAPNPAGHLIGSLSLAGNSMGAISTLAYLDAMGAGEPLPAVRAAVSMSGARQTRAIVPVQFQTSDYDGSPILVGPTVFGVNLGSGGDGIGYKLIKERYDILRAGTDPAPLSLVVLEGGVHTDHVAVPFITRTLWANSLAGDYAQDWLDCRVKGSPAACASAAAPRDHLSRAFASEQDPDGPAGASPSRCIRVPDKASLNQEPQDFASAYSGTPVYDCLP